MTPKPGPGKGNQSATKHGGEGAISAIQTGEPFKGLAAKEEQSVKLDLAEQGRVALIEEQAIRLHTAARLFWNAVQKAADSGDLQALDRYIARFGWLAGASLRAWAELRKEQERAGTLDDVIDYEKLLEAQGHGDTED